jgi:hypothetical protein
MNQVEELLEKTKSVLKTFSKEEIDKFKTEIVKFKLEQPKETETRKFVFSSSEESEEAFTDSEESEEEKPNQIVKFESFDFQMETQLLNFQTNSEDDNSSLDYKNIIVELIKTKKYKTYEQLPDNFKEDFLILQELVVHNELEIQKIPKKFQKLKTFILPILGRNLKIYNSLSPKMKNDFDIVNKFLECGGDLKFLSLRNRQKKKIILKAVMLDGMRLKDCLPQMKDNFHICKEAFLQNRNSIEFIGEKIKENKDFAMYVVDMNPLLIQHFHNSIRGDIDVAKLAISKNTSTIVYLPQEAFENKKLAEKIVSINGMLINRFPHLMNDPSIIKKAFQQNGLALVFYPNASEELINIALKQNPSSLKYLPKSYYNKEIVLKAIQMPDFPAHSIPKDYFKDFDFSLKAVTICGSLYGFLSEELKSNRDIIMKSVSSDPKMLGKIDDSLKDFEFSKLMIQRSSSNWDYFSNKFGDSKELALIAVSNDNSGKILSQMSDFFKDDEEIVWEAMKNNSSSLIFASERLKENREFVIKMLKKFPFLLTNFPEKTKNNVEYIMLSQRMHPDLFLNEKIHKLRDLNFKFKNLISPMEIVPTFEFDNIFEFQMDPLKILEPFDSPNDIHHISDFKYMDFSESFQTKSTISPQRGTSKRSTPKKKNVKMETKSSHSLSVDEMKNLDDMIRELKL